MKLKTHVCEHLKDIHENYHKMVDILETDKAKQYEQDDTFEKYLKSQKDKALSNYTIQIRSFWVSCLKCRPGRFLLNPINLSLENGKKTNFIHKMITC